MDIKEYRKKYYQEHKTKCNEQCRLYYKNNKDKWKEYGFKHRDNKNRLTRIWYATPKGKKHNRDHVRERFLRIKTEVLTHYGNGKLACVKCGFDDIRALSIDHINGGGKKHKREIKSGGQFYSWLRTHGLPEGYQTLCMNCNWIKLFVNNEHHRIDG